MAQERFDLERLRRNFDRIDDPVPEDVPDRLAEARGPRDPYAAGREALAIVRSEVLSSFAEHEGSLAPFLARAERVLEQLEQRERGAQGAVGEEQLGADELRAELVQTLEHIEDLCEVFAQTPRRA